MWSCAKNRKHLNAYVDGELPDPIRREVERHMAGCPDCLLELDGLLGLAPLLENDEVPPVPAGLSARILAEAKVRQWREEAQQMSAWEWLEFLFHSWLVRGATTAALIIGLAMGGLMGWTSYLPSNSAQRVAVEADESVARAYAFDVLSAAPRDSIEAAVLALLDNGK